MHRLAWSSTSLTPSSEHLKWISFLQLDENIFCGIFSTLSYTNFFLLHKMSFFRAFFSTRIQKGCLNLLCDTIIPFNSHWYLFNQVTKLMNLKNISDLWKFLFEGIFMGFKENVKDKIFFQHTKCKIHQRNGKSKFYSCVNICGLSVELKLFTLPKERVRKDTSCKILWLTNGKLQFSF